MVGQLLAVFGGQDDERVFGQAQLCQFGQQYTYLAVGLGYARVVAGTDIAEVGGRQPDLPPAGAERAVLEPFQEAVIQREPFQRAGIIVGRGRLLVRYSGTEPMLRIMIEGERQDEIQAWANALAERAKQELG